MNGIFSMKELKELFRSEKSIRIILIVGAALIVFIALSGLGGSKEESSNSSGLFNYQKQAEYETALEKRLTDILMQIDGIGNITVMITLDSSEQNQYQKNEDEPVYTKTPEIRGVIVVCDGGDNIIIREKVISAVSGAFGISTTRVSVIK